MSAAEHLKFWEDQERDASAKQRKRKRPKARTDEDNRLIVLPLHDRNHLALFLLMEEWAEFPNIRVVAEPVTEWPQERLDDFRRIRVARSEVRRKWGRLRRADSAVAAEMAGMLAETEATMSKRRG